MTRRRVTTLGALLALLPVAAQADPAIVDPDGLSTAGGSYLAEIGALLSALADFVMRLV